jgi:uncharacterized protein (DUF1697 family)
VPRYIAFLRAINVGGRVVKMDRLRALFAAMGLDDVETFIASGNVIFDSTSKAPRALEQRIEEQLRQALGYEVATFLRSAPELAAVAAYQPFGASEQAAAGHALWVGFLKAPPSEEARQRLLGLRTATDDFQAHGREVYWARRTKFSESAISGALLERALGAPMTMRNVTTVRKLAAKYAAAR